MDKYLGIKIVVMRQNGVFQGIQHEDIIYTMTL